jgi:hypothetical protein
MDYFAGLDISMDETHVCVLDREGVVIYESKTASTAQSIANELAKAPSCRRIVFEAGRMARKLPMISNCFSTKCALPETADGAPYVTRMRKSGRSTRRMTCWDGGDPSRLRISADVGKPPCRPSLTMAARRASSSSLHLLPHWPGLRTTVGPRHGYAPIRRFDDMAGISVTRAKRRRRAGLDRGWRRPVSDAFRQRLPASAGMVVGAQVLRLHTCG